MGVARVRQPSGEGAAPESVAGIRAQRADRARGMDRTGTVVAGATAGPDGREGRALRSCSFLSLRRLFSCSSSPRAEGCAVYIGE